jgi:2-(1,2-epoxy-1,2-dihydrophenyl)acetyl-CoA isomerase
MAMRPVAGAANGRLSTEYSADHAASLASRAPIALTLSKRLLAASTDSDLRTQLRRELSAIRTCFTTDDVSEALRAFAEKRPPHFTGR